MWMSLLVIFALDCQVNTGGLTPNESEYRY